MNTKKWVVGLIADTHGLLRPEVPQAFSGVNLIVHAGDVGGSTVLRGLAAIARVVGWSLGFHRTDRPPHLALLALHAALTAD